MVTRKKQLEVYMEKGHAVVAKRFVDKALGKINNIQKIAFRI